MGGGDLNFKKSWHPQRMHNMEKVWLEEKKAEDEGKRIEQIKKEIEEQRKIEEMEQLQEQAGLKKRSNKLEWMYASGPIHQVMEQEEKESYLLGDKKIDKLLGGDKLIEGGEGLSSGKALDLTNANSIRDTQNKIRDDPLFMIKKMEKQSLEKLLKNPIKLAHLKEKKKEKKEKKKSKSKKHSKDSENESYEGRSKSRHYEDDQASTRERYYADVPRSSRYDRYNDYESRKRSDGRSRSPRMRDKYRSNEVESGRYRSRSPVRHSSRNNGYRY